MDVTLLAANIISGFIVILLIGLVAMQIQKDKPMTVSGKLSVDANSFMDDASRKSGIMCSNQKKCETGWIFTCRADKGHSGDHRIDDGSIDYGVRIYWQKEDN